MPPRVLVIAGTDSSGGAGLVRDVQVITDFGAHAACVVTAVTAQTHSQVEATCVQPADLVRQQLSAALRSGDIAAIKIGMLGNAAIVRAVLDELPDRQRIPIVLDPVLASSSGTALLDADGVSLLRDRLLPRCTVITPNLLEAALLLEQQVASTGEEQSRQAEALLALGPEHVLLKGGHGSGTDATDVLASSDGPASILSSARLSTTMRGTGCALSSAIAALLAAGVAMEPACRRAKAYVHKRLQLNSTCDP
ncbi:bifunctional hydroxymethylpyrimidine kinase/phosphomethylpyrimidine kinase [Steroidobacter sp. S1-65]|uniref:hydroxymethylpyrimidine kinase n=1 Tax=Steroidobacter gossypii TaxID=2805490 RepID=A0ABS1WUK9_9GAMM|nr:bifunctional hydroxymethylpyrimidine kinase/phosphomethylpyrimidine kinase [Steroidobacter gossypii]MBM0104667.1 bifunctional hydroxymethylpyrimidine kinase/phosphomethylpyrimidine kinase [Steroidobacter gossypii]